jgi:hypothetical protein
MRSASAAAPGVSAARRVPRRREPHDNRSRSRVHGGRAEVPAAHLTLNVDGAAGACYEIDGGLLAGQGTNKGGGP